MLESRRLLSLTPVQAASTIPFQRVVVDPTPGTVPVVNVVADILGNGKLDVITGHENNLGGGGIFWYEYPASGNPQDPWIKHTLDANASTYEAAYPFDLNGDGAVDVIFSYYNQTVWYENPRGHGGDPRSPWTLHVIGNFSAHEISVADLDGDGKPDIATNSAIYFQNSPTDWTTVAAPNYDHTVKGMSLFDSGSGLGKVDILGTGNTRDNITWWENPRDHGGNARTDLWIPRVISRAYIPQGAQVNDPGLGVALESIDVNGDGRADVISVGGEATQPYPAGGLIWWEAPVDRRNGTWIPHTIDPNVELVHNIRIADANGDGNPDLLIFEQDQTPQQRLMIVYNEGGTGQNWLEQTLATTGGHNEWVGDINGDGALDIVNSRHGFYNQVNPIEIWLNGLPQSGVVRPTITSGPAASQAVAYGAPVTFHVTASGSGPLAFQWQRDGQDIVGATASSYTIAAASAADDQRVFRCIVSNAAGFVTSSNATVTLSNVPPPPPPPVSDASAPTATLTIAPPLEPNSGLPYELSVTYHDDNVVSAATLGNANLLVTGPGGYSQAATLISSGLVDSATIVAVYSVPPPTVAGTYTLSVGPGPVADTSSNVVLPGPVGTFDAAFDPIPVSGPDLTATAIGTLPRSVIGGATGVIRVKITNSGDGTADGTIPARIFFSADGTLSTAKSIVDPSAGGSIRVKLAPRASRTVSLKFSYPTDLASSAYRVGVWINPTNAVTETNFSNNTAAAGSTVNVAPPQATLTPAFSKLPSALTNGQVSSFSVSVGNTGNIPSQGKMTLSLYESLGSSTNSADIFLSSVTRPRVTLRPGAHYTFRVKLKVPGTIAAGNARLLAIVQSDNSAGDNVTKVAISPTDITFA